MASTANNYQADPESSILDGQPIEYLKEEHPEQHRQQRPNILPDPAALFPDPYLNHRTFPSPTTSSSNSASTRSSAYTTSGSNMPEYNHVHIAAPDDDHSLPVAITSESLHLLSKDAPQPRQPPARAPIESGRWSDIYSVRSRSSSIGNNSSSLGHENGPVPPVPHLQHKPSYDNSWHSVDEKDGVPMSEDETDDEHAIDDSVDSSYAHDEDDQERTAAAVVAEEGRALIIRGESNPIIQLQVQQGTTHLLIGSSTTPNAVPQFLTNSLPAIAHSLLALDISANFLGALPPVLAECENLEELNVASNPLRVLPVFLAELSNLRVLIADATGISTLPESLVDMDKLHTLSIRRNKLNSLPSWLCLLPVLQTICVDGNPFQGPWKALVEPLLAKSPMSPAYPPSTPIFPSHSPGPSGDTDTDPEACSDRDPASPGRLGNLYLHPSIEDEDHTITPDRAGPLLSRAATAPAPTPPPHDPPSTSPRPLQRTRTTPNRTYFDQTRSNNNHVPLPAPPPSLERREDMGAEVRKMKSAGDLRRGRSATAVQDQSAGLAPMSNYVTSASSSNLLNMGSHPALPANAKMFGSLGPSAALAQSTSRPAGNNARPQLSKSMWDSPNSSSDSHTMDLNRMSHGSSNTIVNHPPERSHVPTEETRPRSTTNASRRPSKDGKEKSRWGFLKKMSMGKIKPDNTSPNSSPGPPHRTTPIVRPPLPTSVSSPNTHSRPTTSSGASDRLSKPPQLDARFSTSGINLDLPALASPGSSPPTIHSQVSRDMFTPAPSAAPTYPPPGSSNFLAPANATSRGAKRRSFLPFDQPGTLSIPVADTFVPNTLAANGNAIEENDNDVMPSPTTPVVHRDHYMQREEERARETYMRALRSVMAYLKDMNDLAQSQQPNPLSMYGEESLAPSRNRRPTVIGSREPSMVSSNGSGSETGSHLRSSESIAALRSGTNSQTLSVATTDSASSMDERKYKDDKLKRTKIIQEIVATERSYVKGLHELVEIYIKPAATPVNLLSNVGSRQDTVVPAPERKVVFGGIDALFSFHHESFLPALERAAAPLYKPHFQDTDVEGTISTNVAKAVGDIFVKHAAFMRMYSSYINNFDSSVQRVKSWTTGGGAASPSGTAGLSPSSSTAQLVSLSMSMSGSAPPVDVVASSLTNSQRKRIKAYLKRCRMNPRHTQLNLEGYLLLPVQRIPRYKLLLDELLRSTPPTFEFMEDPLERALVEISSLANNMNEGKRDSESRRKLVQWQTRIRGKFPSPLVQPHRRLIMDGRLLLTRVVRKAVVSFEAITPQGDASTVQVDCLAPELTPRPLIGILCNDLLVLCRDPSDGKDPNSFVDLWAVLRMQTLPQPASIVHGNALRLVDNKAILYFDAPSPSDALNWYRAINLHIPTSKA